MARLAINLLIIVYALTIVITAIAEYRKEKSVSRGLLINLMIAFIMLSLISAISLI